MGHVCNKSLCDVKAANTDIEIGKENSMSCVVCIKGKHTRKTCREDGTRADELLQLIHSDVMGPFPVKSFSGCRFLVTFVDDYSRKIFAYPIQRKSDVFEKFTNFKKLVENQCSKNIKIFRTDNRCEYLGTEFQTFLTASGIVHQRTCP